MTNFYIAIYILMVTFTILVPFYLAGRLWFAFSPFAINYYSKEKANWYNEWNTQRFLIVLNLFLVSLSLSFFWGLKDVITKLEPELFKKVTGLKVEDFALLERLGVFNSALMNDAVFKFKRYEDSSLNYTGVDKHHETRIGGFDTTIEIREFEEMKN